MHVFVKRALWGVALAGGLTLLGASAASAAETGGEDGLLSGTQLEAPLSAPVTILDNAVAVLGDSSAAVAPAAPAAESTPATPAPAPAPTQAPVPVTDGSDAIGSGSQAVVDADVPVGVSGNAIAILGDSRVSNGEGATGSTGTDSAAVAPMTAGEDGVLSGTQAIVDATVPVTVGGNSIALLGESDVSGTTAAATESGSDGTATDAAMTNGQDSTLGGTQVVAPIEVPITIGDNGIAILGDSTVTDTVPGVTPVGTDPGTDPGADPGTTPGITPAVISASLPVAMAAGSGMLATTGIGTLAALALGGLGLLEAV